MWSRTWRLLPLVTVISFSGREGGEPAATGGGDWLGVVVSVLSAPLVADTSPDSDGDGLGDADQAA